MVYKLNCPISVIPSGDFIGIFGGSDGKESACNVGDPGLIPGLGRFTGEGNGNTLQYFCLGVLCTVCKCYHIWCRCHLRARNIEIYQVFFPLLVTITYVCSLTKSHQLYPTLCNPVDWSPPGSSVHGILQTRILKWVAMPSSRGASWPMDRSHMSYI